MGVQPEQAIKNDLPQFRSVARQPQQFNLNIAADVTYEKIAEMAKMQLLNKTFSEGGNSITILGINVYGSEGRIVCAADVTGTKKGKVYFTGKLIYNPETKSLEVLEPEFDIRTRNALVKSANWLLHGMILKKISPFLSYPLIQDLEYSKIEANKMLQNYSLYQGISVSGKLDSLAVTDVNMIPGAVRIQANIKGNVGIKIEEIQF
jgi:hypothetical protein